MNNHDIMKNVLKDKELLEKITPKNQAKDEIKELIEQAENPKILAGLLYRVVQEKENTNKLLNSINSKYDDIMFALKTNINSEEFSSQDSQNNNQFEVLAEQDQLILKIIDEQGQCTANDIKTMLNYKGLNAACQRLNKLYKEGYLKKIKSGRKVLYLAKS